MSKCDHDHTINGGCIDCGSAVMRPTVSSEMIFMANDVLIRKRGVKTVSKRFMRSSSAVKRAVKEVGQLRERLQERIDDLEAVLKGDISEVTESTTLVCLNECREYMTELSKLR